MADYTSLISRIEAAIRENGENLITGPILQAILKDMINSINPTKADTTSVPTQLSQLQQTVNYRTVSDAEKTAWNAKSRAEWSSPTEPHPTNPQVDNYVYLTVTNGTSVGYFLALANHTHPNIPTAAQIASWNAKSDFSGSYNDLTDKPDIIEVGSGGGRGNPIYIDANSETRLVDFIATHPEAANNVILPSLFSDISFLLTRGGNCIISGSGFTYDSNDRYKLFDSAPSYLVFTKSVDDPTITIQLQLPQVYYWNCILYIDFGSQWWGASNVRVQWGNGNYNNDLGTVNPGDSLYRAKFDAGNGGVRDIQITLSGWQSGADSARIAEIGLINFDGAGLRGTAMSRGIDDEVWRSITPATNNLYSLGTNAKKWASIFANYLTLGMALITPAVRSNGQSLDLYVGNTLCASLTGSRLEIYSGGTLVMTLDSTGITPSGQRTLGTSANPWTALVLATSGVLAFIGAQQFISLWSDDIVLNQGDGNSVATKRLLYNAALINNVAHHFYATINGVMTQLFSMGVENISCRDLRPDANTRKLGTSGVPWGEIHGNRWFPKAGDDSVYAEFVNGRFVFNGNLIVTGYLGVGEIGAATSDQYVPVSVFPSLSTLTLGNEAYKWLEVWTQTLFASALGTSAKPVASAYITTLNVGEIVTEDRVEWSVSSVVGQGSKALSAFGASTNDLEAIRAGKIMKIYDPDTDILRSVVQVEGTEEGATNTVVYFGRNLKLTQLSSTTARIDTV